MAGLLLLAMAATAPDAAAGSGPSAVERAVVRRSVHNDTSAPLRDAPPAGARVSAAVEGGGTVGPKVSFEGLANDDNVAVHGFPFLPPDPTGEAGPHHYVQAVNRAIGVFSKTGVPAEGFPKRLADVWAGFGGPCELHTRGDPILLYDQLADRWVVSQFAEENGFAGPFFQCIAVSATGDPTGSYHRYQFFYDDAEVNEYPKLAVWPDGYFMSVDEFTGSLANPTGVGLVAFERDRMLAGLPAAQVQFEIPPHEFGLLPSDVDGFRLPPPGSPNYFVSLDDQPGAGQDHLELWRFSVDFAQPETSTLTGPVRVPVAPFDSVMCGYLVPCVPQPNTLVKLQTFSHTVMFRAAYRNFGSHESIVFDHTVDVDGTDHAGIHFFEVRAPGSPVPQVAQQGTFAPDADHRWMGSAAMDRVGNLAVGYSVSGVQTFPSVRYAWRLATDPPGTLRGEGSLVEGGGSQTSLSSRWGDYSHMSVDPVDDCTFWYTQEYYATTSQQGWRTRIGAFELPGCAQPVETTTVVVSSTNPSELGAEVTFSASVAPVSGAVGVPAGEVTFSVDGRPVATVPLDEAGRAALPTAALPPGEHTVTASYGGDGRFLASASAPLVQRVTCRRTVSGPVAGSLVLDAGSWCVEEAAVGGSVTVRPGAAVWMHRVLVSGGIESSGARLFLLCSSLVRGPFGVRDSSGLVVVGDPAGRGCGGNVVREGMVLEGNGGGAVVATNVLGDVAVRVNTRLGPRPENRVLQVSGNRIRGDLVCAGNEPPPGNGGRPNLVAGARTGQCSGAGF